MNDNEEQVFGQENAGDVQPACDGGSCCPSGSEASGKSWKLVVFMFIVIAAGVVLTLSVIRKSSSAASTTQKGFATIQPEEKSGTPSLPKTTAKAGQKTSESKSTSTASPSVANVPEKMDASATTASTLWGKPLDSLASLNKVAAKTDAVFIFLTSEDQESNQNITKKIETAAKTIQSTGVRISAFTLQKKAPNYAQLANRFQTPCVLAMVKGRGMSSVTGEITQTKLAQAFVVASRPAGGCCGAGSTSCGPTRPGK